MTRSRFVDLTLALGSILLAMAFVLLPRPLATAVSGRDIGDQQLLTGQVGRAFVRFWHRGTASLPPDLTTLVDAWRWYHLVKTTAAIALTASCVAITVRAWRTWAGAARRRDRRWSATVGIVSTLLAFAAMLLALANLQAALAPFSSLLSLLPVASAHGGLAATAGDVAHAAARYPRGSSGALHLLVDDLATYHLVVAVAGGASAAVLAAWGTVALRRGARTAPSARRLRRAFLGAGTGALVAAAAVAVLAAGNASAVVDSATAVENFYRGSF